MRATSRGIQASPPGVHIVMAHGATSMAMPPWLVSTWSTATESLPGTIRTVFRSPVTDSRYEHATPSAVRSTAIGPSSGR